MSDSSNILLSSDVPVRTLVETVRKSLSHDVRTPLGTIVNYAAVLESIDDPRAGDVHALARKVRENAMHAAGMLQQISDAVGVLTGTDSIREFAIAGLLDDCLQAPVAGRSVDVSPGERSQKFRGHAAMLVYLWRSVFRFDHELRGHTPELIEFEALCENGELDLKVWLGPRPSSPGPVIDMTRLMRDEAEHVAIETRLALELALGLVESTGGDCTFHGNPGASCAISLRLPLLATAAGASGTSIA